MGDIDYHSWLDNLCKDPDDAERRKNNVTDLLSWLKRLTQQDSKQQSLGDHVSHLCLQDILERNNEKADIDAVRLMTLHAAKGLEFNHVIMVGVEEEILPHRESINNECIEEERRLAYVGITRARKTLTMTHARKRKFHGEIISCDPSRFIKELPEDIIDWKRITDKKDAQQSKRRSEAYLSSLKALLAEG